MRVSSIDLLSQRRIFWSKDEINRTKHGLSFEESSELFKSGVDYLEIYDEEHSEDEDRFIAVGPIKRGVIVVAFTEREDDVLRLLSARVATKNERRRFEAYEKSRHERRDS
ncbi:MAG TPA: BrnT family toxin [Candidatus Polarisedimenticolia bacterium]|nr:BrnT family toxin [Candidatus Polarisedimenticolia bacterium]